jgi:ubiquinone/menaquinone biosynthesis C-methylase UbiE
MKDHDITFYDQNKYDYSNYWKNRDYEHQAEVVALKKCFKGISGNWVIDLGGSYGRHTPQYYQLFHNCVLLDYSIDSLKKASEILHQQKIRNVHLIAANIYHLPFKDDVFDAALMVRVLHHLEDSPAAIQEISRIIASGGDFILEFANKHHLKAVIAAILRFDFRFIFSKEPYLIPSSGYREGLSEKSYGIIYNYNPNYIKNICCTNLLMLKRKLSLSFFRIRLLKKIVPPKVLIFFERIFQFLFSWSNSTPSIIYKFKKDSDLPSTQNSQSIESILACPACKSDLAYKGSRLKCQKCGLIFEKDGQIFDLRYPHPDA